MLSSCLLEIYSKLGMVVMCVCVFFFNCWISEFRVFYGLVIFHLVVLSYGWS